VLLPVPWEATASYGLGTACAPEAIVKASGQVDLLDREVGTPYRAGIAMLEADRAVCDAAEQALALAQPILRAAEAGEPDEAFEEERARVDELCRWLDARVRAELERWLDRDRLVGVVGGDHSVAFGAMAAHAGRHAELGVLQIDAHADLRKAYQGLSGSHASVMYRVLTELSAVSTLVQVGVRDYCEEEQERMTRAGDRVHTFFGADLAARRFDGEPFARTVERIVRPLPEKVYVSFDVDGLDPALCPHTGTPVPGGLGFDEASAILGAVGRSGRRIVGFDLCEVAPGPDGDEWDANVGARLLYKLIGHALRSQGR